MTTTDSIFTLPDRLAAKREPALISPDERHFDLIGASLEHSLTELSDRLAAARRALAGSGQNALERDLEVHRLTARLRSLRRFGPEMCLGRMVYEDDPEPVYIGRSGVRDVDGTQLLLDWRSPAAEPFFGATHANPMGLASRRRYRWTNGRISDYWDEAFTAEGLVSRAALDDQSAFIASLGSDRSDRMRDVLGTIQADQDAVIRTGSEGALVVDGGPGTGKTVVALHRTAYLLYSDPRLQRRSNGVLFVGPSQGYLSYIDDVLPSLGEDSVQICTLRDLVPEGESALAETDPDVARVKSSAELVKAIDSAVKLYERPPSTGMAVQTPWADVWISPSSWAEAFSAADPSEAHNDAREQVREALLDILVDSAGETEEAFDGDFDAYGLHRRDGDDTFRGTLAADPELSRALGRAWPLLEATDLVARLFSVPAFLASAAPWLEPEQVALLQREASVPWTESDLPLLDAARQRLGDPESARIRGLHEASVDAERSRMDDTVDRLIAADDSDLGVMKMLRGQDLRSTLVDESALPTVTPDVLAGPFAHIVVDEAQELTDAEWQMLLIRCPSRSFTIVGDRAQARHGFTESWEQRLERVGFGRITTATLTMNYRTPREIMAEAESVIRVELPDANIPTSIREGGVPVHHGRIDDRDVIIAEWLAAHEEGTACVIGDATFERTARVQSITPELAKGLEFDLVVLIDPMAFGPGIEGAVDRYVAMTRATQQLVVLVSP